MSWNPEGDTKEKVKKDIAGNFTVAGLEAMDRPDGAQR